MVLVKYILKSFILFTAVVSCTHSVDQPEREVASSGQGPRLTCEYLRHMTLIRDRQMTCKQRQTWKNYGGTVHNRPALFVEPRNEDEVARIVFHANRHSWQVRPVGSGHSWSQVTKTDDILMGTNKLVQQMVINPENLTVTVGGGQKVREMIRAIEARGYALANLGDAQIQSVAGVVSTNTHGTGITHTGFAGAVQQIRIVDGRGNIHVASATQRPQLFRAALSGAGMMGVITQITLKVVPAYNIYSETEAAPLQVLLNEWRRLLRQNEWFSFLWIIHTDWVTIFTGVKANFPDKEPRTDDLEESLNRNFFTPLFASLYTHNRGVLHRFLPSIYSLQRGLSPKKRDYAVGSDAISKSIDPKHWAWNLETEFFIPIEHLDEFIIRMRQYVGLLKQERIIPAAPMIGFRFIKGDNSYLSPAYIHAGHSEFVAISVFDTNKNTRSPYLLGVKGLIDDIVKDKKLMRMHVGKVYLDTPEEFHQRFAHWATFAKVRKQYDPNGVFLNPWTERFF